MAALKVERTVAPVFLLVTEALEIHQLFVAKLKSCGAKFWLIVAARVFLFGRCDRDHSG
jgi:hypothetical protein